MRIYEAVCCGPEWYMSVRGILSRVQYRSKTKLGLAPFFAELKRSHAEKGYEIIELTSME